YYADELAAPPKQSSRQRTDFAPGIRTGLHRRPDSGWLGGAMAAWPDGDGSRGTRLAAVPCDQLLARFARQQWHVARLAAVQPLLARRRGLAAHPPQLADHHALRARRLARARADPPGIRCGAEWRSPRPLAALADGARGRRPGGGADVCAGSE